MISPGTRVQFQDGASARLGTVVGNMPAGMVDVRFDDGRLERRHENRLSPAGNARQNPAPRTKRGLSEKVRRVEALQKGATTAGEKAAADAALRRIADNKRRAVDAIETARLAAAAQQTNSAKQEARAREAERLAVREHNRVYDVDTREKLLPAMWVSPADIAREERLDRAESERSAQRGVGKDAKVHKTTRIAHTELKTRLGAGLLDQAFRQQDPLVERGAVWFTQDDPVRYSARGAGPLHYCGNPVDGLAYYLTVAEAEKTVAKLVKKADVEQVLLSERASMPAQVAAATQAKKAAVAAAVAANKQAPDSELSKKAMNAAVDAQEKLEQVLRKQASLAKPDFAFMDEVFLPRLKAQGLNVFEYKHSKRDKGVRVKGGNSLSMDLLPPGRKGGNREPGNHPDPQLDFHLVDERGRVTFYKYSRRQSLGMKNLERFQAYTGREFPVTIDATTMKAKYGEAVLRVGVLAATLHAASGRQISPDVARALVVSGAVSVSEPGSRVAKLVLEPDFKPLRDSKIHVGLYEKANDPLFSWVPAIAPLRANKELPKCLTSADRQLLADLGKYRFAIASFGYALERVRSVFARLAGDQDVRPTRLDSEIQHAAQSLVKAYARLSTARVDSGIPDEVLAAVDLLTHNTFQKAADKLKKMPQLFAQVHSEAPFAWSLPLISEAARSPDAGPLRSLFSFLQEKGEKPFVDESLADTVDRRELVWAAHFAARVVYPELAEYVTTPSSEEATRNLLLLAFLYVQLEGVRLVGSLDPNRGAASFRDGDKSSASRGLLDGAQVEIRAIEDRIQGGSSLEERKKYTTYMTYNPVLFELTRVHWPSARNQVDSPDRVEHGTAQTGVGVWGSILGHARELVQVDSVGLYGNAARATQLAAQQIQEAVEKQQLPESEAVEMLQEQLLEQLARPTNLVEMLRNKVGNRDAPRGWYTTYAENWPLGTPVSELGDAVDAWYENPVQYVAALKKRMISAVGRVFEHREKTAESLPFLVGTGASGLPRTSVLAQDPTDPVFRGTDAVRAALSKGEVDLNALSGLRLWFEKYQISAPDIENPASLTQKSILDALQQLRIAHAEAGVGERALPNRSRRGSRKPRRLRGRR